MATYGDPKKSELRIIDNLDDLTTDLAEYIAQLSETAVKERGSFTIALSGGSLISLMGKLCEAPYNRTVDWTKWYVFWADERAVAKNHVDSNYKLAKDGFLSKVSVLNSHIYSINDNVTVEQAADEYEFAIRQLVKARTLAVSETDDCPRFDLVLLTMGADGHVASLFPYSRALRQTDDWVTYITGSPEPPPERITITLPVINSASNVAIVAVGQEKATTVHFAVEDRSKNFDTVSLPARLVEPTNGKLVWFMDSLAASQLRLGDENSLSQKSE